MLEEKEIEVMGRKYDLVKWYYTKEGKPKFALYQERETKIKACFDKWELRRIKRLQERIITQNK